MRILLLIYFVLGIISQDVIQDLEKIVEIPLFKDSRLYTKQRLSSFQRIAEAKYLFKGRNKFISSGPPAIALTTYKELQYWGHLTFGSQKTKFKMMFDTGSGWTWIPSEFCYGCKKFTQNSYACSLSRTCTSLYLSTSIHYGKGNVKGIIVTDDVWINSVTKAKAQPFLMITEAHKMPKLKFEGISGLGFRIMTSGFPTLVDTLFETGAIAKKSFSVYLESQHTKSYKSSLIFGGTIEKYKGEKNFHYCNVISPIYWAVKLDYVKMVFSDKEIIIGAKGGYGGHERIFGYKSVIDTGTSVNHFHRRDFVPFLRSFLKNVPNCFYNGRLHMIECFNVGQEFPTIKLSFCGKEFDVKPVSYLWGNSLVKVILFSFINSSRAINIMGDVFMKEYYFDFDQGERKIGIMKKGKPQ